MLRGLFFIVEWEQPYIQAYITMKKRLVEEIMIHSVLDVGVSGLVGAVSQY